MKFRIKEARERMGLSQKELATILNIKPTTFNGYETGAHDPKSDVLVEIAKTCDTTVDFLLGLTCEPQKLKKSPAPAEPGAGETINFRAELFYKSLIDAGYLAEGEDFTDAQVEIVRGVLQILSAAFPRRKLPESSKSSEVESIQDI